MLFSLLSGEHTKIIDQFKMDKNPRFGFLKIEDKRKFYLVFSALKDARIIDVNTADYGRITVLKKELKTEDFKSIFALIKF